MTKAINQDFLRGTDGQQARVVKVAACVVIAIVVAVTAAASLIYPRYESRDTLPLSIDVPHVAPGIAPGTKVILHGAEVGEITALDKISEGSVRMSLSLRPGKIHGLTDAFDVDFRPENYFGVTAVNIVGRPGGGPLVAGRVLDRTPAGDFTMSTMLEKGSLAVDGTLTKTMIGALDKVIRYTDGLTPMIQTGVVLADRVAATQRALPSTLLSDLNSTLEVMPAFDSQAIDAMYSLFGTMFNQLPDGSFGVTDAVMDETDTGLNLTANSLFGAAGHLLASHGAELTPVTGIVSAFSDVVPDLLDGGAAARKLSTLIDRYNKAFSGPENAKSLNLRIVLDDLPMFAAPLAATGVGPGIHKETTR